jgi:voltage-gated potassium channel
VTIAEETPASAAPERLSVPADRTTSWLHRALDPAQTLRGLSTLNLIICAAIILSVLTAILETEPTLRVGHERIFRTAELAFAGLFCVEYALRLWCAGHGAGGRFRWMGMLRWAISATALIDLIAIIPGLLLISGAPAFGLRLFRIVRILRIARLGKFSRAWAVVGAGIASRRFELGLTFLAALMFMLVSATAMYLVEGSIQPAKFGSIPRALWWAAVTLTTIGYGDVTPVTPLGRMLASLTAFVGIGLVAAPTGILAAAFSEAAHHRHVSKVDAAVIEGLPR